MPKISVVDQHAKTYQDWLQPESPDHLTPRSLSSELVLTHEWHPGHHTLEHRITKSHAQYTSTGAGTTPWQAMTGSGPADGWVRWIIAASLYLTATKVGFLALHIGAGGAGNGSLVCGGVTQQFHVLPRPLVITPNMTLSCAWVATGAGEVGELEAMYADFRCCEPLPRL